VTPEEEARTRAAIKAVDSIKAKLAAGAEFRQAAAADFFVRTRDAIVQHGNRAFVSKAQLGWLESIAERMKAKRK
jgi:hypothetical protein